MTGVECSMNRFRQALVACVLSCTALFAGAEDWQLVKDEAGIQVYLATVPGSSYKAYRGVTTIKAPIERLRRLQEDVVASCRWIFQCQAQKMLKSVGAQSWVYSRFSPPWPVAPRDSVLQITTSLAADGTLTRRIQALPEYLPVVDGWVRVSRVDGYWTLRPRADGLVEVLYQAHTEPGGSVPSWLANSFVVDAPFETLRAYRALAQER